METILMPMDNWMVKENVAKPYNGLLFSNTKKRIIDICYVDGSEMLNKGHVLSEHMCIEFPEKENL